MKKCPFCAEEVHDEAIKCKHCGEMLESRRDPPKWTWASDAPTGLQLLGLLLLVGGAWALIYYWQFFDTSVDASSVFGGRVHNLGLMQDRQTGLLIGIASTVAGVFCLTFACRRRP